jgi:hypothetical protein
MSELPHGEHTPTSPEQLPLYIIEGQGSSGIVAQLVGAMDQAIDQLPVDSANDTRHFQDIDGSVVSVQRRTYDYKSSGIQPRRVPLKSMHNNGSPTGLTMYAVTLQSPANITTLDVARNHGDGVLTAVGKSAPRGTTDIRNVEILPLYAGHGLEEAIKQASACVGLQFEISQPPRELTQSAEQQTDSRATITGPEADAVQAHLEPFAEALRQTPDDPWVAQYSIKRETSDSIWQVKTFMSQRQLNIGTTPHDSSDGEVTTWVYLTHTASNGVLLMSAQRTRSDDPISTVSYYITSPEGLTPIALDPEMRASVHEAVQGQITPDNIEFSHYKSRRQE